METGLASEDKCQSTPDLSEAENSPEQNKHESNRDDLGQGHPQVTEEEDDDDEKEENSQQLSLSPVILYF